MNFLLIVLLVIKGSLVLSRPLKDLDNAGSNSVRTKCVQFSKRTVCQKQGIKYVINQNREMPFNIIERFIELAHSNGKKYIGKHAIFECSDDKLQNVFECKDKSSGSVFYINVSEPDKRVKRSLDDNQMEEMDENKLRYFNRVKPRFLRFAYVKKNDESYVQHDCVRNSKCPPKCPTTCTTKCPKTKKPKCTTQIPDVECLKEIPNCNMKEKREGKMRKIITQDVLEKLISLAQNK